VDESLVLRAALIGIAYLSGSIPFGVLASRLAGGPDPRSVGSGRTGGTNAMRALGWRWAGFVVLGDLAKGAAPVLLARVATGGDPMIEVACAAGAVLGAWRSAFLGFAGGGRGVGTGVGTMLVIEPIAVFLAAPVFFGVILLTRYVSLGSLLGSAAMLPATLLLWAVAQGWVPPVHIAWAAVGAAIIWIAHADNIDRLLHGTERKFDLGLFVGGPRSGGA
jgi:glycerol-3-phosphate acyltransferase PlsY